MKIAIVALVMVAGCTAELGTEGIEPELEDVAGPFVAEPFDEAIDPEDPPTDPDPLGDELGPAFEIAGELEAEPGLASSSQALCRERVRRLSPKGLTFAIHISKDEVNGPAAVRQLRSVRALLRQRDIFVIERTAPWVRDLRAAFPCNRIDFIAYPPDELPAAYDSLGLTGGIAVDWERGLWAHDQAWTIEKLTGYAESIHRRGGVAGVVPYWPESFDDARIVQASGMDYEIAQIQDHCAHGGPLSFGGATHSLVRSFHQRGLGTRNIGVEISLNSYPDAANHTGVDASARCTRHGYGRGARAIYLYGNGPPHLAAYFRRVSEMGLRAPR